MVKWTVSQKNIYSRVYSGMVKSNILGRKTYFLTLTSNPVSVDDCEDWDDKFIVLQNSWRLLHKRIVKRFGSFDYLNVRVAEAHGVIHVVYRGVQLPNSWLVESWNEIHGSHIIDNVPTRGGDRGSAQYLASQYFGGQKGKLVYGSSKDWIYQGSTRDYIKMQRFARDWSNSWVNRFGLVCARIDKEVLHLNWKEWLVIKFGG